MHSTNCLQLDVPAYITATAVSPTGAYLAFGDNEGVIHLMSAAEEGASIPFNGFEGRPIEWADTPEPLPEIEWRDTTYVGQSASLQTTGGNPGLVGR